MDHIVQTNLHNLFPYLSPQNEKFWPWSHAYDSSYPTLSEAFRFPKVLSGNPQKIFCQKTMCSSFTLPISKKELNSVT